DRGLVAELVGNAVDAAGARGDDVEFAQRRLFGPDLGLGSLQRGFALRQLFLARAVQEFVQRRLRCTHLRLGVAGRGAGAIDFGRGNQLALAQWLQARVVRAGVAGLRLCSVEIGTRLGDVL